MNNFYDSLPSVFSVLAPMEDVTDVVFRRVVNKYGKPDVFFTEFTNCDGICSIGQAKVIHRLKYDKDQYPIVAQIWGKTVANYEQTARLCFQLGFDGVDINMGCPEKNVIKIGACSALINDHQKAKEIINAVKKGVNNLIPVSVKTRIGFDTIDTDNWIGFLLNQNIQALTIHGRTVKELSNVDNHFDQIASAVILRDKISPATKIIANGDILDRYQGEVICNQIGSDGYMIGRGVFKNILCFNTDIQNISKELRLEIMKYHINEWVKTWTILNNEDDGYRFAKNYSILKKYFKIYLSDFENSAEVRAKAMETTTPEEVLLLIDSLL